MVKEDRVIHMRIYNGMIQKYLKNFTIYAPIQEGAKQALGHHLRCLLTLIDLL